ncbi:MAG: folD [Parcubacteria group bacterium]|nr:folD [Parcubacteria group bacterium]
MTLIINGKSIAEKLLSENFPTPIPGKKVCFVSFGENAASRKYMEVKMRAAKRLGIEADIIEEKADLTEAVLLCLSDILDKQYDGIVIQLPLPPKVDTDTVVDILPFNVDIDMLSREAKSRYREKKTKRVPPVAEAIDFILQEGNIDPKHKKIVILGKGRLVGEVVGILFDKEHISYDVIDKETSHKERDALLIEADIIISGIGEPHFIKPEMIKEGVALIDAGTSGDSGELKGDIDPACADKASLFTPVPGSVGPITIASLFANLQRE